VYEYAIGTPQRNYNVVAIMAAISPPKGLVVSCRNCLRSRINFRYLKREKAGGPKAHQPSPGLV